MRKRDREGVRLIAFRQEREEAYFKRNRRFSSRKRRADWKEGKERWEGEAERDERKRREREKEENDKQLRKEERGDTRQEEWDSCHRWKKRIRGCKESPLRWDEGGTGMREGEGDRREKRHRLRPCCIYHIITIIEPRTTRRHLLILHLGHPRPTTPPSTAATANWKLANTFSLRCSLFSAWNCLLRDVDRSESMLTNNHWNRGINVGQARNFVHFTDSWWFKIISLF